MILKRRILASPVGEGIAGLYLRVAYSLNGVTETVEVDPFGSVFIARSQSHADRVAKIARLERPMIDHLAGEIRPTDVFVDIGADFGFYTCLVGSYLGGESVVAVEPYPPRIARLRANLRLNTLECHVERRAWGASGDDSLTGYTTVFDRASPETVRGDDALDQHPVSEPTVVKVDVDGGEYDVLAGLEETLKSSVRLVYVEVHPSHLPAYGRTVEDVEEVLAESGLEVDRLFDRPNSDSGSYYLVGKRRRE